MNIFSLSALRVPHEGVRGGSQAGEVYPQRASYLISPVISLAAGLIEHSKGGISCIRQGGSQAL